MGRRSCSVAVLMLVALWISSAAAGYDWIRPEGKPGEKPAWGHRNGIRIGLRPEFPYGLLTIYCPPVSGGEWVTYNYFSVEPVVKGRRGLSELEHSALDNRAGKRMWSARNPDLTPRPTLPASGGTVFDLGTTEVLSVFIMVEPFENGAIPYLRLTFRSDSPFEVQIEAFAAPRSAPMDACIVSATMGNFARLRRLHLRDRVVTSHDLWPDFSGTDFAPSKEFPLDDLARDAAGGVVFAASPDERDPAAVRMDGHWWDFRGRPAVQYWRVDPDAVVPDLIGRVNGRATYWASDYPIPGGVSFENFELQMPFRHGQRYYYGIAAP
ncbi:MAG: hypothetical protein N2111_09860 [Candidatus Sumerlaeaceae bacterium]|nr:hypothetical protein [Candidatus Sumerlaeaceae bacterium]